MKLQILIRKIGIVIYSIFIIISIYKYIQDKIILFPSYKQYISYNTDECSEYFLKNNMITYNHHPYNQNVELYENLLFFFNNSYGNCNMNYIIIKQIRQLFPDYTIIQIEYPGFGLLFNVDLSIKQILSESLVAVNYYLTAYKYKKFGFFGDGFGAFVMGNVYSRIHKNPKFMIHYNGITDLYEHYSRIFPFYYKIALLPLLKWKKIEYNKKNKNFPNTFILISNKDNIYIKQSNYTLYLELYQKYKNKISIHNIKGNNFLFIENLDKLKKNFKNV
tara:strand:+ start:213 stop:1040 length:828 start_codon:yes stop_codon:yes gene_type:complete